MAIVRAKNWEDKEYDNCGNTTIAVVEVGNISIPLCRECYSRLNGSVRRFNETTFCYQCIHFVMSSSGWRYGGICRKKERDVDCMDTCAKAAAIDALEGE